MTAFERISRSCKLTSKRIGSGWIYERFVYPMVRILIVRLIMRALNAFLVSGVFLSACTSRRVAVQPQVGLATSESAPVAALPPKIPTSQAELLGLMEAANNFAAKEGQVPEPIRKLRPLAVYFDNGNVVIALQRDEHWERGYYIVPWFSSWAVPDATFTDQIDPLPYSKSYGWNWKPIDKKMLIYEYTLRR